MFKINFAKLNGHAISNAVGMLAPFMVPILPLHIRIVLSAILSTLTGIIAALDTVVKVPAPAEPLAGLSANHPVV